MCTLRELFGPGVEKVSEDISDASARAALDSLAENQMPTPRARCSDVTSARGGSSLELRTAQMEAAGDAISPGCRVCEVTLQLDRARGSSAAAVQQVLNRAVVSQACWHAVLGSAGLRRARPVVSFRTILSLVAILGDLSCHAASRFVCTATNMVLFPASHRAAHFPHAEQAQDRNQRRAEQLPH